MFTSKYLWLSSTQVNSTWPCELSCIPLERVRSKAVTELRVNVSVCTHPKI